jgi:hypothetical protein
MNCRSVENSTNTAVRGSSCSTTALRIPDRGSGKCANRQTLFPCFSQPLESTASLGSFYFRGFETPHSTCNRY